MTVTVYLRANQVSALSWAQIDGNFAALRDACNANTNAIAGLGGAQSGTTAQRPTPTTVGQPYFDTTLGYTVWAQSLSPVVWVNASGVSS